MQSFSALATRIVNALGASGYPALQTFLSQILDRQESILPLLSSKKMFFVLLAAATAEMLEEVF
jgi:DNA-binding MurR/RpiR family transcriptional regulator